MKGRVSGSLRVVDYLRVRADGRRELELRGGIETDDGNRIAFAAEGVGTPRTGGPIVDLAVRIDLLTAAGPYFWVNAKPLGVSAMRISPRSISGSFMRARPATVPRGPTAASRRSITLVKRDRES